jgi:hypothetical protein
MFMRASSTGRGVANEVRRNALMAPSVTEDDRFGVLSTLAP